MDIVLAKRRLYNELRERFHELILGAGIKQKNGVEYIVIFLAKRPTKEMLSEIPELYNGNKVETEIRGRVKVL